MKVRKTKMGKSGKNEPGPGAAKSRLQTSTKRTVCRNLWDGPHGPAPGDKKQDARAQLAAKITRMNIPSQVAWQVLQ